MSQPNAEQLQISSTDTATVVSEIVKNHMRPELMEVKGGKDTDPVQILILPDGQGGQEAHSVKKLVREYATKPERREGQAVLTNLDSLIAHTNRFKDADSVVFANDDPDHPALSAVLDYHRKGADADPRFGKHTSVYRFPLSDEWKAWSTIDNAKMSMVDFAEFLEDRIIDVMPVPAFLTSADTPPEAQTDIDLKSLIARIDGNPCGPEKLSELSKQIKINEDNRAAQTINLQSGEASINFTHKHTDEQGAAVKIPNMFLIAIPVFKNGPSYRILVRLRYRLNQGNLTWILSRHRPELAQQDAFAEACERVAKETELPVYFGSPE